MMRKEGCYMKMILKIILFPVALVIDLLTWIAIGMLSCSAFVFSLVGTILSILAFLVMLTCSVQNGIILLVLAFLVSPMGLPLVAAKVLVGLKTIAKAIRSI